MKRLLMVAIVAFIWPFSVIAQEDIRDWNWEKALLSVVLISTEQQVATENFVPRLDNNPQQEKPGPESMPVIVPPKYGMGTGFFIDSVHVVTNYHVIKDADIIKVYSYGYPFEITEVTVVGYDEEVDLAVLRINKIFSHENLEFVDEDPLIGDEVYALGHGASQMWSLTQGIIGYDTRPNANTSWVHYLQTDAVINHGNSGGPLMDEHGQVVGVNTLIISQTKFYVGYGYAIPSALVERVVKQIIATGQHVKPLLGIHMGIIDDKDLYDKLAAQGKDHLLEVKQITPGGPAELFGVKEKDIIVKVDGKDVYVTNQVIRRLWDKMPGETITLEIYRDGEYIELDVILGQGHSKANTFGLSSPK